MTAGGRVPGSSVRPLASATLITLGLQVLATGLGFVAVLMLTRGLGASGYGTYAFGVTLATLLTVFSKLGIDTLLVREVAVAHAHRAAGRLVGLVRLAGVSTTLVALGLAVSASAIAWGVAAPHTATAVTAAMLLLVAMTALAVPTAVLRGLDRPVLASLPGQFLRPLLLVVGVGALLMGDLRNPTSALLVHAAAAGAGALAFLGPWRKHVPRAEPAPIDPAPLARAVPPLVLLAMASSVVVQADLLVLQALVSDASVGIYAVVAQLVRLVGMPLSVVNKVVAPRFATAWTLDDRGRLQRTAALAAVGISALTLPLAGGLWAAGTPILTWFGPEFGAGAAVLPVLLVGQVGNALCGSVGTVLLMAGRDRDVGVVSGIAALTNLGLDWWLIPTLGILGAAIGSTSALLLFNVLLVVRARTHLGIDTTVLGLWRR